MTSLEVVPFEPEHVAGVIISPAQSKYQYMLESPEYFSDGLSVFSEDELIAVGLEIPRDGDMGVGLLFTENITPKHFISVHLLMVRWIKTYEESGIKLFIHVDPDYPQAQRWAELLGFSSVGFEDVMGQTVQRFER